MKVQILPKKRPENVPKVNYKSLMGALTFKPISFQVRPWELTSIEGVNYLDGGALLFHHRGGRVQRITLSTNDHWLRDRTRFSFDGFRRQRLTVPLYQGQPCSWPKALNEWFTLLFVHRRRWRYRVDPAELPFWWLRWYLLWSDSRGRSDCVAFNTTTSCSVYHGGHGLSPVAQALLSFPACLPHEEDGTLSVPCGGVTARSFVSAVSQVWNFQRSRARLTYSPVGWSHPARQLQWSTLQVSPLQHLLAEW